MEKMTIGKFISVLRRANGMTQKELGDRLYVSDKTVSRWERDECTPDLSLIPAIADIFGVTIDELLRGEKSRIIDEDLNVSEYTQKQRGVRGDKQFKTMLNARMAKFKSLSCISVGITVAGLIAAMICNLGFSRGILGFCVAFAFILASIICQLCFMVNARLRSYYENDSYEDEINKVNTKITLYTINLGFINIAMFGFVLPLGCLTHGAYTGLAFDWWLWYGILFSAVGLLITYAIYVLTVRKRLVARGILLLDDSKLEIIKKNNKALRKYLVIVMSVAFVLYVAFVVVNSIELTVFAEPEVFDNYDDFKIFMSNISNLESGVSYNSTATQEILPYDKNTGDENAAMNEDSWRSFDLITDKDGNVLCEYENTYFIGQIKLSSNTKDGLPIKVYTDDIILNAKLICSDINSIIIVLIAADIFVCTLMYILAVRRNYKRNTH